LRAIFLLHGLQCLATDAKLYRCAGEAVTFFTEDDAPQLRAMANVMRASGCEVPAWMLGLSKGPKGNAPKRAPIGTGAKFDREQARKKRSMIEVTQRRAAAADAGQGGGEDEEEE
jgi:ATP-dependent RNA helicase DDX52/ROK1